METRTPWWIPLTIALWMMGGCSATDPGRAENAANGGTAWSAGTGGSASAPRAGATACVLGSSQVTCGSTTCVNPLAATVEKAGGGITLAASCCLALAIKHCTSAADCRSGYNCGMPSSGAMGFPGGGGFPGMTTATETVCSPTPAAVTSDQDVGAP
ncbi:MAG: hypothetical protein RL701_5451 [Pseudomonadota bacterium]|jgi:hypothetical protein